MAEILGRDGETKEAVMAWFQRRGLWKKTGDRIHTVLNQLNALQLDYLAGAVTAYGMEQYQKGETAQARKDEGMVEMFLRAP